MSPNTNQPLPIQCPKCHRDGSKVIVSSVTVMTCTCERCGHVWATEMPSIPEDIQQRVREVLDDH
jgi:uncharacterized Zn finger protein